jgi:hypothetical protein
MKRGKAAGLDGITIEHLQYGHPLLICCLSKLFNHMVKSGHIPLSFGQSYTVPLLKSGQHAFSKSLNADDFRGISISPALSKVLEHCILDRYSNFFVSSDNQFGFKKGSSCANAIYLLRGVVDHYINSGSTINVCSIDLAKAFDKMNHHGLFIRLMHRQIPVNLLSLIEKWFAISVTCIKWENVWSTWFCLGSGTRQGGVLSPYLFALFIDSLVDKIRKSGLGCHLRTTCANIILYADDILLLAPSVSALQKLLSLCEEELLDMDMSINAKKSFCIRIGPRYQSIPKLITCSNATEIPWVSQMRNLGIYIVAGRKFSFSLDNSIKRIFTGLLTLSSVK